MLSIHVVEMAESDRDILQTQLERLTEEYEQGLLQIKYTSLIRLLCFDCIGELTVKGFKKRTKEINLKIHKRNHRH